MLYTEIKMKLKDLNILQQNSRYTSSGNGPAAAGPRLQHCSASAALFAQITLCLQPIVFNIDEMCNTNHSVLSFHYFLSALDKLNKSVDVKNNNLNLN